MTTSQGWIRANILYDSSHDPPSPGSPLEAVLAFVFTTRQRASYLQSKLIAQAMVNENNKDAVQEALTQLHEYTFPDMKEERIWRENKAKEILERQQGPIAISPLKS